MGRLISARYVSKMLKRGISPNIPNTERERILSNIDSRIGVFLEDYIGGYDRYNPENKCLIKTTNYTTDLKILDFLKNTIDINKTYPIAYVYQLDSDNDNMFQKVDISAGRLINANRFSTDNNLNNIVAVDLLGVDGDLYIMNNSTNSPLSDNASFTLDIVLPSKEGQSYTTLYSGDFTFGDGTIYGFDTQRLLIMPLTDIDKINESKFDIEIHLSGRDTTIADTTWSISPQIEFGCGWLAQATETFEVKEGKVEFKWTVENVDFAELKEIGSVELHGIWEKSAPATFTSFDFSPYEGDQPSHFNATDQTIYFDWDNQACFWYDTDKTYDMSNHPINLYTSQSYCFSNPEPIYKEDIKLEGENTTTFQVNTQYIDSYYENYCTEKFTTVHIGIPVYVKGHKDEIRYQGEIIFPLKKDGESWVFSTLNHFSGKINIKLMAYKNNSPHQLIVNMENSIDPTSAGILPDGNLAFTRSLHVRIPPTIKRDDSVLFTISGCNELYSTDDTLVYDYLDENGSSMYLNLMQVSGMSNSQRFGKAIKWANSTDIKLTIDSDLNP